MKGFNKGVNFHTTASPSFGGGTPKPATIKVAGYTRAAPVLGKPRPKQSLQSAHEEQGKASARMGSVPAAERPSDKEYADRHRVRMGNRIKSTSLFPDKVGYAKGGVVSPGMVKATVNDAMTAHQQRAAPQGHKGLKVK